MRSLYLWTSLLASILIRWRGVSHWTNLGLVMQALEVVHSCGLAHLDLKGNNAMVQMDEAGEDLHLTVIDFGAARPYGTSKL